MTTLLIQANSTPPHNIGTTAHVRFIRRPTPHGSEVSRYRCSSVRCYSCEVRVACRHPEQGRPGLRVAPPGATLFLRLPVRARNGHGRSGPGALRSRPLRLRLCRSRPAPTTRGSSGGGDENLFHMRWRHRHDRARAVQTGRHRNTAIPQSDFARVVGRVWVCSRLSWIFGAHFSVRGCVRGVGSAREESADLRASIPATLRHAPSRVGRRRGSLGLTPPQPRLVFQAEPVRAHIGRPDCALRALVSEIAIAHPSLALPKCPRTTKTTALLGRPYPFKWRR